MVETLLFLFIVIVKEGMVEIPNWKLLYYQWCEIPILISETYRVWGLGIELELQGMQIN